jgi:NAD(P)-dependent dehydrogenase (short-subunit alcohol dehydrogenase family)
MLTDKVCVVTGAGGGIGRATAVEMGRRGARVVVSDVNVDGGRETASLVEATGAGAVFVAADISSEEQVVNLMSSAVDVFGGIDVLHNNAGVHETDFTEFTTVDTLPMEVWTKVYEVNLRGTWLCTKYAAPHLRASMRGPSIVNAGSVCSTTGYPNAPVYCTTKGAIVQLTKVTAIDLAPVRANCYLPGSIDTDMVRKYIDAAEDKEAIERVITGTHLIRRLGEPQEIANLVCFLASDEASFITGGVYEVDGGALAWRGSH